ncbi:hypothetical protein CJD36_011130 [Flavipsychrobacter stenotrophus]|uniref:BIG2 domain-containing protein n=1 Tax=Flavipsychrobacter stenotrophus TaxID=2077091 RepID=A0A2S7SV73_9BACT|nr:T9SS type A sorting domain-containing protein [Flavipsychrobacter stenotrophus]PQJ10521.1 hypothetical protein CJD36_011130 [Flavipsychrobacter stenotrophus]
MSQINLGGLSGFPAALKREAGIWKTKRDTKESRFSKTMALLSGAILLSLQLLSGKADAQIATYHGTGGTSTSVTYAANSTGTALASTGLGSNSPCGSGGLSGLTNNGVTTYSSSNGHVYFTVTANPGYVLNVTGYTAKLRRSGSGLSKVRMAYVTTGGVINDLVDKAPDNTGCGSGSTVFSWSTSTGGALPTGVTSFTAELFPYAPLSSGGTIQFNDITINGTVTINPVSCPGVIAAGTVTPSSTTICGGNNVALALTGFSTGTNIAYQWQSSPDGITYGNITGATNTSYNAVSSPSVTTTTYYKATTTCTVGGASNTSSVGTITVNPTPNAGAITGSLVLNIGGTATLTNPTASTGGSIVGVWNSSNTSVATIDNVTGNYGGVSAGNSTISYTATDVSAGCDATTTANVSVVFPGTLATYIGTGGTSTTVTGIADETVSALAATGFTTATPCTTGGLSGLTIPTSVTSYSSAGPRVAYTVTANAGHSLNIFGFWVKSRSSGTGPDMARLAYSIDGGTTWIDEGVTHTLSTSGSCGANTNTWHWVPSAAISGAGSIIVAVFPYHSASATGTFQVNTLEVDGVVSSSSACSVTPVAGVITPSVTVACLSGYASLSFAGDAGPGISYSWEADNGSGFAPIAGASNTSYLSPVYTVVPTNITYRVVTTCASVGSANSTTSAFSVVGLPAAITGTPSPYLFAGASATLTDATAGGTWSSSNFSVATVDPATGVVTGLIPGYTVVRYSTAGFGCSVTSTVAVVEPSSISAYLGTGGNSTTVTPIAAVTTSALSAAGSFGSATACGSGGLSGLTVNNTITSYAASNPHVVYTITPATTGATINVTGIHATVRSSATGPQLVRIAYSTDGGTTWTDNGTDLSSDIQSCGVSTVDVNFAASFSNAGSIMVAVYPFASVSSTGTFQVNALDVTGTVTCPAISTITELVGAYDLNGTSYSPIFCTGITAAATPAGGSWSSSDVTVATVDAATGQLFFLADGVFDVAYTAPCGNTANATITVNSADGPVCDGTGAKHAISTTVANANTAGDIKLFPNPATNVLNISAAENVNVVVLSMDGKTLIEQTNAKNINVSKLATGVYMVKIYNSNNNLIKTVKFEKN